MIRRAIVTCGACAIMGCAGTIQPARPAVAPKEPPNQPPPAGAPALEADTAATRVAAFTRSLDSAIAARAADSAKAIAEAQAQRRKFEAAVDSAMKAKRSGRGVRATAGLPLVLTVGIELSNAFNFSQTEVSPAIGVAVVGAGLSYRKFRSTLAVQSQLTQGATVREFNSCRVVRTAIAGTPLPGVPSGVNCAPQTVVGDTTFQNVLTTDSIRFSTADVWRAFVQGRIEYGDSVGVRVGPVFGFGIQSNPNNLTDPRQQQLKVLGLVGAGVRQIESDGYESFSFEIAYGAVQNYFQQDRLGPTVTDGIPDVITEPGPPRRTNQWQAYLTLRPIQSFRIRLMSTLGAPAPSELGQPPVPDLARIAFMTDRRLSDIVTALVGGEKREPDKAEDVGGGGLPTAVPMASEDSLSALRGDSVLAAAKRAQTDSMINARRDSTIAAAEAEAAAITTAAQAKADSIAKSTAVAGVNTDSVRVAAQAQADTVKSMANARADSVQNEATARAAATAARAHEVLDSVARLPVRARTDSTRSVEPDKSSPRQSVPF